MGAQRSRPKSTGLAGADQDAQESSPMLSALTAGLATLFGLLAAGVHPSADPEFGVTAAFVLGIASLAGGASLVSMVGVQRGYTTRGSRK
jgi:hypothetical protein